MSTLFGIQNNSGYGASAPGQIISIDSPLPNTSVSYNTNCPSPISGWTCSMSTPSGNCEQGIKYEAYIVTGACGSALGQLDTTTGSQLQISAYDTSGSTIFSFIIDVLSGKLVKSLQTTYTFPAGATVTYGCSVTQSTNPSGGSYYVFTVDVASVSTQLAFVNNTKTNILINYPQVWDQVSETISDWSGMYIVEGGTPTSTVPPSSAQPSYVIPAGTTATGVDFDFIKFSNQNGSTGAQLAGYGATELFSYLVTFPSNASPVISPASNPPSTQGQYIATSSYSASTNTCTITIGNVSDVSH